MQPLWRRQTRRFLYLGQRPTDYWAVRHWNDNRGWEFFWRRKIVSGANWRVNHEGCWLWSGRRDKDGYGIATTLTGVMGAHRYIYGFACPHKSIKGLVLDHICLARSCVNPQHLELVTASENSKRVFHREIPQAGPDA